MFNSWSILQRYPDKVIRLIAHLLVIGILTATPLMSFLMSPSAAVNGFVIRSGNKLMLNGQQFRFSGTNIY